MANCTAIEDALGVLGRTWAGAVLSAMLGGAERFSEIKRAAPGVSDAVLTARLRELCARGFAVRHVDAGPPVGVRYALTDLGRDTRPVLEKALGASAASTPTSWAHAALVGDRLILPT